MDTKQLKQLIAGGESEILELKKSIAQLKPACKTICAFLNGQGGKIVFGVTDSKKVVGQTLSDATKREIAGELDKIEPTAQLEIDYINVRSNREVIILTVPKGHHAPYIYDGRPFQRNQSTTQKMSQHRYEQLLVQRGQLNYSWEEVPATDYLLADLDQEIIYRTVMDGIIQKRIPASISQEKYEKILRQLNLIVNEMPTQSAVVLFAKKIAAPYMQCCLKMALFKGTTKLGDFIDSRQVYCNVFTMLEEVDYFLNRHLSITSELKSSQWKRKDKPVLPKLAIREALINAICHRNYADRSGYISIAIFDDRLEIWNNGTLPNVLTVDDLKHSHDSILRNKLISNIFYLCGYIETWGTGTIKITQLCEEYGLPPVEFVERTGGLAVIFRFKKTPSNTPDALKQTIELNERQKEILTLLAYSSLNRVMISEKLKDLPSPRTLQRDLVYLEKAGLIQRKGKTKSITWHLINKKR